MACRGHYGPPFTLATHVDFGQGLEIDVFQHHAFQEAADLLAGWLFPLLRPDILDESTLPILHSDSIHSFIMPFTSHTNLTHPRRLRQAQRLNQMLPPLTTPLLLPQIPQQLLPPMHQ